MGGDNVADTLIDHKKQQLSSTDYALAEFYHPVQEYTPCMASWCFKGLELVADLHDYNYALDMLSLGCILAGMSFFHSHDNYNLLVKITSISNV